MKGLRRTLGFILRYYGSPPKASLIIIIIMLKLGREDFFTR